MLNQYGNGIVSVIIPTYHGAESLSRAIQSVLDQSWKLFEIIVVDDNDPESAQRKRTELLMEKYKDRTHIKYIKHEKNLNGAAARNTGIYAASGKYICFLDDDDVYVPERIEKSVCLLEKNPEYDCVLGATVQVNNKHYLRIVKMPTEHDMKRALMLNKSLLGTGSNLFFTASSIKDIGGFDVCFRRHQDLEFMIRYFRKYKAVCTSDILCVKFTERTENMPNYNEMKAIKNEFFSKFCNDIAELSNDDRRYFYIHHYEHLLLCALNEDDLEEIKEVYTMLGKFRNLGYKDKLKIGMSSIRIGANSALFMARRLVQIGKKFNVKKIEKSVLDQIPESDRLYIDRLMGETNESEICN